ncbi:MAG TPA: nuclear transport factor 2 family protein, partial [Pyrinomonadaceae bacterium]|nr:nuclear transport factor 2 family protein [Pyrinomonadaceae bacterium]
FRRAIVSAENKQAIEGLYAAFGRGDVPFVLSTLHPEIEWWEAESFIYADKNPYRGPQSVLLGVFARLVSEWDGFAAKPDEVLDAGDDAIVACGHYIAKHKKTGRAVKAQFAHVFKFKDGKVVKFQQYTDTAQFREAVAVSV